MIDRHSADLVQGLTQAVTASSALGQITSGRKAAGEIINLMNRSATPIPPTELVDGYIRAGGTSTVAVQDRLWTKFGDKTIDVMADGAKVLAGIWAGAWAAGGGGSIAVASLGAIDPD